MGNAQLIPPPEAIWGMLAKQSCHLIAVPICRQEQVCCDCRDQHYLGLIASFWGRAEAGDTRVGGKD